MRIVNLLASSGEPVCVCDLVEVLGLAQPTVSHHLRKLVDAGPPRARGARQVELLLDRAGCVQAARVARRLRRLLLVARARGRVDRDVRARVRGRRRDHGRRQDACARPRRRRDHVRARDHGDDLRGRPRLRRALQSGRLVRVCADAPFLLDALLGYWIAQAAGALLAAAILRGSLGNRAHLGATLPAGSQGQAFLWEAVLTFFLMFVIMSVATDTRAVGEAAAIAIGGTVGLDAMFGGPITGASMNPARSLGPGARLRRPARALDLPRCTARRSGARRPRVPVRARRDGRA